jgi:thiamine kinase
MAVDYIPGDVQSSLPDSHNLAALLYDLHRCPPFGWRLNLLPLLETYWQQCLPSRRTLFWLQQLKARRRQGEPLPLRLAPLHMDVHAGNLVHSQDGLRLIDWEYAGDGDIAMELAASGPGVSISAVNWWLNTHAVPCSMKRNYGARSFAGVRG